MTIKWHKGPPPSVGWWPARVSLLKDDGRRRYGWFDGLDWSVFAQEHHTERQAAEAARSKGASDGTTAVLWADRPASWPKRSRT